MAARTLPSIKLFADTGSLEDFRQWAAHDWVQGFTSNPTLLRQSGVTDYEQFVQQTQAIVGGRPVSYEVFHDDLRGMELQAVALSRWAPTAYIKIPITNTKGESTLGLVRTLGEQGIKVNVTAVLSWRQICEIRKAEPSGPMLVSIFAGRIADTGINPVPMVTQAVKLFSYLPNVEVLWASPRRLLDLFDAADARCHIITCSPDILRKIPLLGRDLDEYSLDTVRQFHEDGAGLSL